MNHITLTDEERLDIYKVALKKIIIESKNKQGACASICAILSNELISSVDYVITTGYFYRNLHRLFPEFYSFKPENKIKTELWWPCSDYNTRIEVLGQCVRKLEIQVYYPTRYNDLYKLVISGLNKPKYDEKLGEIIHHLDTLGYNRGDNYVYGKLISWIKATNDKGELVTLNQVLAFLSGYIEALKT